MRYMTIASLILLIGTLPASLYSKHVDLIEINGGTINPISAEYINDAIANAEASKSECLILLLDTPGGLLSATQSIVKDMLASNVPLVVYVYPSGSGAVSAGVSITIAAHIAAMASGTSIGAAHPVTGAKTDSADVGIQKATNWWASFNRSIAEKRGRNADWVEQAVIHSVSITETEALKLKVIDFICPNLDSLLIMLDGRTVDVDSGKVTLQTKNASIRRHEMGTRSKILDMISNPSIAYFLMIIGLLGLYFEFSNPGLILPGVIGGICIILFLFSIQQLPISVTGILLIIFATILFVLEIKVPSYGILTIGGIISMILGSLMLFKNTPTMSVQVPLGIILTTTLTTAAIFVLIIGFALRAQTKKITTGSEGIIGEEGVAISTFERGTVGNIKVHGEYWKAESLDTIEKGNIVIVEEINRLRLKVRKRN
ncbi:nodulation protein NfeD [candidate division KSB1 bacterium]|nr:nodulation protein NfeD [candidate division KSB1 bacterium]